MKINYYFEKLFYRLKSDFNYSRIRRFGISISVYGFLVFMMHRGDSWLECWLRNRRSKQVEKFIYREYGDIIKKYSSADEI